ncbi:hypothetical protein [Virgibacillus senegalensis]|uniref:hypothetical protein n=1 Tax=Virgibacillus senegalensis TaxID=1499679 RepID=UPI00069CF78A|nr:hypothetical protein [Virgibacillus senegalensis]
MKQKQLMITEFIIQMEPKIKKSVMYTSPQERDDLEQEIKLKMIETVTRGVIKETPGFWEFKQSFE